MGALVWGWADCPQEVWHAVATTLPAAWFSQQILGWSLLR